MLGLQWNASNPPRLGAMRALLSVVTVNADGSAGSTVATIRGAVLSADTLGPEEGESAQAIRAQGRYLFATRFRTDITVKMRGTLDGVTYEIRSLQDPDGARRWLVLDLQSAQ